MENDQPDIGTFIENGAQYGYINIEKMEPGTVILAQTPTEWYIMTTIEKDFSGVYIEGWKNNGHLIIPKQSLFLFGGSFDSKGNSLPDLIAEYHSFFGVISNESGNSDLQTDLVNSIHVTSPDGTPLFEPTRINLENQILDIADKFSQE